MSSVLDLRTLKMPDQLLIGGRDRAPEARQFVATTVTEWTTANTLPPAESYGLSTTNVVPVGTLMKVDWNDPAALLGFAITVGDAGPRYALNGLRKLRPLFRSRQAGTGATSSLQLLNMGPGVAMDAITDEERKVEQAGGLIRWGDFFYGGAVYCTDGVNEVGVAPSAWPQRLDDRLAGVVGTYLLDLAPI